MARQRRSFSADFKARVALEAVREQKTINELASEFGVHPNLIREWKKHLLDELPQVFSSHKAAEEKTEVLPNVKTTICQKISGPSDHDVDDFALWLFSEQRWCRLVCLLSCYPQDQFTTVWST